SLVETRLAEPEEPPSAPLDLSDAPLPSFFLEWAQSSPAPSSNGLGRFDLGWDTAGSREEATMAPPGESLTAVELMAAMERSGEAQLLSSFNSPDAGEGVLDFGLPTVGEVETREVGRGPAEPRSGLTVEPFAVRVGSLGWSGVFRREVESGRPC